MEAERSLRPKQIDMMKEHTNSTVFSEKSWRPIWKLYIFTLATIHPNLTKNMILSGKPLQHNMYWLLAHQSARHVQHTRQTLQKYLTYMDKARTEDPQQGPSRTFLLHPTWGAWGAPPVIQLVSSEVCWERLFQLEWVEQHTLDATTPAPTHPLNKNWTPHCLTPVSLITVLDAYFSIFNWSHVNKNDKYLCVTEVPFMQVPKICYEFGSYASFLHDHIHDTLP